MTQQLTTTNAIPERITAEHYQMLSSTGSRTYDLVFVAERGRWLCNCPDTRHNFNDNCKHRRRLITWIAEQSQSSQAQREATAIADVQEAPAAIATAEQIEAIHASMAEQDRHIYNLGDALIKAEWTIKEQSDKIACLEFDLQAANREYQERITHLEQTIAQAISQITTCQADIKTMKKARTTRSKTTEAAAPNAPRKRKSKAEIQAEAREMKDREAGWENLEHDLKQLAEKQKRDGAQLGYNKPFNINS